MSGRYSVVVVGGGPAGLAAGIQAARRGLPCVVLERGEFASTIHGYSRRKWVMDDPQHLGVHAELAMHFKAGTREAVLEQWQRDAECAGVEIRTGPSQEVVDIDGSEEDFRLRLASGEYVHAGRVVIAIGSQGNRRRFSIEGEWLPHVQYELGDPSQYSGRRSAVVGANDSGIEDALSLAEVGSRVSLINARDDFRGSSQTNRRRIKAAIADGDVKHVQNSAVVRFKPSGIVVNTYQGERALEVDVVIGRLGAAPPRTFLEKLRVRFASESPDSLPIVSERFETTVPGIYIIGSVLGRRTIKACMNDGYEVIEHVLGNPVTVAEEPALAEVLEKMGATSISEAVSRIGKTIPLLEGLNPIELREVLAESRIHHKRAGEIVFENGDMDQTLYSILEGEIELVMADRDRLGGVPRGPSLSQGEFFGEMSLFSERPRSYMARSATASILIETPRAVVQRLRRSSPIVSRILDTASVASELAVHLPALSLEEIDKLAEGCVIETYQSGDLIFEEGDVPDGLRLIRRGAVLSYRDCDGQTVVLQSIRSGESFGASELLLGQNRRASSVRSLVATETILIEAVDVLHLLEARVLVREQFQQRALEYMLETGEAAAHLGTADLLNFLTREGGRDATNLIVIDEALCTRCDNCEDACAATHGGVSRIDREGGPRFARLHIPISCRHCENPRCMLDCPPDAIQRNARGEVYILDSCIGCGNCASNCPYDAIQITAPRTAAPPRSLLARLLFGWSPEAPSPADTEAKREVAVKCDLCRDVPGRPGGDARPACVAACPTGALVRARPADFNTLVRRK